MKQKLQQWNVDALEHVRGRIKKRDRVKAVQQIQSGTIKAEAVAQRFNVPLFTVHGWIKEFSGNFIILFIPY